MFEACEMVNAEYWTVLDQVVLHLTYWCKEWRQTGAKRGKLECLRFFLYCRNSISKDLIIVLAEHMVVVCSVCISVTWVAE